MDGTARQAGMREGGYMDRTVRLVVANALPSLFAVAALVSVPISAQAQNALSQLAASLAPGSWQELVTTNIAVLNQNGTDGNIIPYGADAAWDQNSRQLLFVGNDHIDSIASEAERFVIYSADTNSWRNMPPPPWSAAGVTDHGYFEHAIDASRGVMYRRAGKSAKTFGTFNVATETWSSTAADSLLNNGTAACCSGADYFPELNGLVHAQGGEVGGGLLRLLDPRTGVWSTIAQMPTMTFGTFTYAAYNPVMKVLLFGQNAVSFKLAKDKTVQSIPLPPFSFYDGSGFLATLTADPVSGEYLSLSATSRQFYSFDVSKNAWKVLASTNMPDLSNHSVIAEAVPNYGVILFVACQARSCKMFVYRHAAGTGQPVTPVPAPPSQLKAN
jgi:hypothetical protein